MSNKFKKVQVYNAERVIALGTGEAEGSIMVLATRFNKRVVVTITPEFMGELAKFVSDYAADIDAPPPVAPQPVVDATYDDDTPPTPGDVAAELDNVSIAALENEGGPPLADTRVATE